jgi:hypothetical protein
MIRVALTSDRNLALVCLLTRRQRAARWLRNLAGDLVGLVFTLTGTAAFCLGCYLVMIALGWAR